MAIGVSWSLLIALPFRVGKQLLGVSPPHLLRCSHSQEGKGVDDVACEQRRYRDTRDDNLRQTLMY